MHDNDVGVFGDEGDGGIGGRGEIDVGFVDDDEALVAGVRGDGDYVWQGDESTGWVTG